MLIVTQILYAILPPPSSPPPSSPPPVCYEYRECTVVNTSVEGYCAAYITIPEIYGHFNTSTPQGCFEAAMAYPGCHSSAEVDPPLYYISFGAGTRYGVCLCDRSSTCGIMAGTGERGDTDLRPNGYFRYTCYEQGSGRSATSTCAPGLEVNTLNECEDAARYLLPIHDPTILNGNVHPNIHNWSSQPLHRAAYVQNPPGHPAWAEGVTFPDRCFARMDWSTDYVNNFYNNAYRPILFYSERNISNGGVPLDYSNINIQSVDICKTACSTSAKQDPHLALAHGGHADFRGKNNTIYSFISAPNVSVAMTTHDAMFWLHGNKINGSFMTIMHGVFRTLKGRMLYINFDTNTLNDAMWGWKMVRGSCAKPHHRLTFSMSPHTKRFCDEIELAIDVSTLSIKTSNWSFEITANPVYDSYSGPTRRLDFLCEFYGNETDVRPHGLIGQSYDGGKRRRIGKTDNYPEPFANVSFTTEAMAEGAIDGVADDYILANTEATAFQFSRF